MTIKQITLEEYQKMSEDEKIEFYQQINNDNPRSKSTTHFATKKAPSRQAKIPEFLSHQSNGKLTYIAPLTRIDKQVNGLYFLTICDCGNWNIVEGINYRKENQTQCVHCALSNITTMKNIAGNIYGQLQAIYPLSERGSDGSVYWMCKCIDCGHEQKVIKSNLRENGHLCAVCGEKSKGEFKIAKILEEYQIPFEKEKIFIDCIFQDTKAHARFDFYVNNTYIIEVDGQHHFYPIAYGGNVTQKQKQAMYMKVLAHDRYKNQYCIEHKIPLIRIPYFVLNNITYEDLDILTSKFLIN